MAQVTKSKTVTCTRYLLLISKIMQCGKEKKKKCIVERCRPNLVPCFHDALLSNQQKTFSKNKKAIVGKQKGEKNVIVQTECYISIFRGHNWVHFACRPTQCTFTLNSNFDVLKNIDRPLLPPYKFYGRGAYVRNILFFLFFQFCQL